MFRGTICSIFPFIPFQYLLDGTRDPFHTLSPMEQEGARCSPDTQGFDAHPYGLIHDERTDTPHPHFVSAKRKTLCQDTYEDKVPGTRFQDMT